MPIQPVEKINPRVPLAVFSGVLLLLGAETCWLLQGARANRDLERTNLAISEITQHTKAQTADLRANENRIKALSTRLGDAIVKRPAQNSYGHRASGGKNRAQPGTLSPIVKDFTESGCKVISAPNTDGDLSLKFDIDSNKLELHRLLPLLSEQENSNAFLVVDSLTLTRPDQTPPFSLKAVALESHLTVRLLAAAP